jgi:NADH:ubiquinone oxidoreductase subunit E
MTDPIIQIQTCGGRACKANGIASIFEIFAKELGADMEKGGISADGKFELIRGFACQGKCGVGPIVTAWKDGQKYVFSRVDAQKVKKILGALR